MMITEHKEWYILDSTKISVFQQCPRKFFYEHILGWRTAAISHNDKEFGTAWHKAMAYLALNDYSNSSVAQAYMEFEREYRKYLNPETDELFPNKNPKRAMDALVWYVNTYKDDHEKYEFLKDFTEISGTVLIHPDLPPLHFRMDSVVRVKDTDKKRILERKTATKVDYRKKSEWQMSTQTGMYTHVLYCLFPEEEVDCLVIDAAPFGLKTRFDFERFSVVRSKAQMQAWLTDTIGWIDDIKADMEALSDQGPSEPVLQAFKRNPQSCGNYWGCPYIDFCTTWTNPLQHATQAPLGFKEEFWDPSREEARATYTL
jgi:hypothetical protein